MQITDVSGSAAETTGEASLVLRYSHHVIEHLGLKLYQNRPTSVIAELVSNGWDANASVVWINSSTEIASGASRYIAVGDNGDGMTLEDLAGNYLVIGKPKDRSEARKVARYPMGRKGIGKLAPFGIARTVDLVTAAKSEGGVLFNWLRIELSKILELGTASTPTELVTYPPKSIVKNGSAADVARQVDPTGEVAKFLAKVGSGTGTLVLMSDLSLLRPIPVEALRQSMGRRFTVTLTRDDFSVEVSGSVVTEADALPEFEFRVPPTGVLEEQVGGRVVRFWVGFVKTASWPSDEAGIGIYAHGKIAQDRPFTFGVKGREIFTRYMYGVVEADFVDELDEDVISTDRRSIDWDHPQMAALHDWGQKKVRQWIEEYRSSRRVSEGSSVRKHLDAEILAGKLPNISSDERDMISGLLSEVTPGLDRDEAQYSKVTSAVVKAYLHRPTRELLKKLWAEYRDMNEGASQFLGMTDRIATAAIPEALSLAVTFAQRGYALSVMYDMQHHGTEPDLQGLIEKFPWILQPDMELLTANQRLKTLVESAAEKGLSPSRYTPGQVDVNEHYKPDFVYFSDVDMDKIVVVEIKSPREDLTFRNREQLASYMVYIEQQYPKAERKGYLVGTNGQGLSPSRTDIEVLSWTEVFVASRRGHIDMLAAMLSTANPDADDDRVRQILEFGGDEVWELLTHVAANDDRLAELLANRPRF